MTFIEFAMAHGIIIDKPPRLGVWERYPTETHPKKRNGSCKWMGDYGFVQDHAAHSEVLFWRADKPVKVDARVVSAAIKQASEERQKLQQSAAMKASTIVNKCVIGRHEYLVRKGFPDERALIWCHDKTEHLIVPMRDETQNLVGLQTIDALGEKRFLYGQQTRGANFMIGRHGFNILCEGYATGLSVRDAVRSLKCEARVYVCFSAGNLATVARRVGQGVVIADHDKSGTGEKVARETGFRYWMSEVVGEDFNDAHRRLGLHAVAQQVWRLLYPGSGRKVGGAQSFGEAVRIRKAGHQCHASIESG